MFSQEEDLYVLWVLLAQGKWKCTVGISYMSQLPIKSSFHNNIPIPLANICFLWMMLEDAPVRQFSLVVSPLWIFSSPQISSAGWARADFHASDFLLFFGSSGNRKGNILWSAVTEEGRSFWRKIFFLHKLESEKEIWDLPGAFPSLSFAHRKLLQPFGQGIADFIPTTNSSANILILPNWAKISNWAAKHIQPPDLQVFLRSR